MITIQSGKIIIPENERFVGFAGDNLSCTKEFFLPDGEDSGSLYTLYLKFDDGRVTSAALPVHSGLGGLILTWTVRREHLLKAGIVMAQIKETADGDTVSHTGADYFIVASSAELGDDGAEIDILHRTEFEERMAAAVREARAIAPYIGDDGYWYVYDPEQDEYVRSYSANNITVDSSIDATSTNPVENRAVKAYVDAADALKTDKTTKIAGIALSGNISAADLYENMSDKINPRLVTIGVTSGLPGQYGRTIDQEPVYCKALSNWIKLATSSELSDKMSLVSATVPANSGQTGPDYTDSAFTALPVGQAFYCYLSGSQYLYIKASSDSAYPVNQGLSVKVDKTRTIAGVDLQDDITAAELSAALGVDAVVDLAAHDNGSYVANISLDELRSLLPNVVFRIEDSEIGYEIGYLSHYDSSDIEFTRVSSGANNDGAFSVYRYGGSRYQGRPVFDRITSFSVYDLNTRLSGKMSLVSATVPANSGQAGPDYTDSAFTALPVGQAFYCYLSGSQYLYIKASSDSAYPVNQGLSVKEDRSNKVTSISSGSTDTQYPSAKCMYDIIGDIERLLSEV